MIKRLLLALALMVVPAFGTVTQIVGTLVDASGTPVSGTACFKLPVNAVDTSTSRALSPRPICFPVTNGTFPAFATVVPNDVIQPINTYYQVRVVDQSGATVFMANYAIPTGGGTFNIGLAIPTTVLTTNISFINPGGLNTANTWTQLNTFSGGLTSAGPSTFNGALTINGGATLTGTVVTPADTSFQFTAGNGTSVGGGSFVATAGNSSTGSAGFINLIAGSGTGSNLPGGNVTLTPGAGNGSGANGIVTIPSTRLFYPSSFTFANLGTPANGALVYCSNCTIANPCAGAGTGAMAKRLNGVWVCN